MTLKLSTTVLATSIFLLTGCGGNDAAQRKAFASFLQTRILDKPGLHVPQLTRAESASFGRYASQYAIITNFNQTLDQSVSPKLASAMSASSITSIEDLTTQKTQLLSAKATIDAVNGALGGDLAKAEAAHVNLTQPADVKLVFDKAFDRTVTQPANAFKAIVPVMDNVLGQAIDFGDYIESHRASVHIEGSTVQTTDPAVRAAIADKLQALQTSQQAVQLVQTKMQSVVYGAGS